MRTLHVNPCTKITVVLRAVPLLAAALAGCDFGGGNATATRRCEVPAGTTPFSFAADEVELFGFIDAPSRSGRHPAVLMVADTGPTHITREVADFEAERRALHEAGFAVVVWDKAGSGCSGGRYGGLTDLYRRADEVIAAIDALEAQPAVDADRIGLWAVGQGAWVAPTAAARRDVSFMLVVGAPGGDPIDQIVYQAGEHLAEQGYSADVAGRLEEQLRDALVAMRDQASFREYRTLIRDLAEHPLFAEMSEAGRDVFAVERRYDELRDSAVLHLDIGIFMAGLELPVLAIWGDNDEQVNWRAAREAFREAFMLADNDAAKTEVVDGVNHRLCRVNASAAGDEAEQERMAACRPDPAVLQSITAWALRQLPGPDAHQTRVEQPAER